MYIRNLVKNVKATIVIALHFLGYKYKFEMVL